MSRLFNQSVKRSGSGRREGGFTLLEVMMAAVILTVGLLAMGTMEGTSVGTTTNSRQITLATAYGEEVIERIHRNSTQLSSYNGFDTSGACGGCSGMVLTDFNSWKARITQSVPYGLPGGRGQVTVTAGSPLAENTLVTVTMTWNAFPFNSITLQTVF